MKAGSPRIPPNSDDSEDYPGPDETILSLESCPTVEERNDGPDKIIWQPPISLRLCTLGRCWAPVGRISTQDQALRIRRIYARGKVSEPKRKEQGLRGGTCSSFPRILKLRKSTADTSEGAWLFPSSRKRRDALMPLDYYNWLNRVLKPLGDRLGIRVNHQILRRTFASLAYNTGGDLKDIQAQMRHASVNTTANVYTNPSPRAFAERSRPLTGGSESAGRPKKS